MIYPIEIDAITGAEWLRKRYKHVLCDEWQDVDKCQYELLKALVLPYEVTDMELQNGLDSSTSKGGVSGDGVASGGSVVNASGGGGGVSGDGSRSNLDVGVGGGGRVGDSDTDSDGENQNASADVNTAVHLVYAPPPTARPLARTLFVVGDTAQVTPLPLRTNIYPKSHVNLHVNPCTNTITNEHTDNLLLAWSAY